MSAHSISRRQLLQNSALLASSSLLLPKTLRSQSAPQNPIASTSSGKVRGFTDQSILVFKSIPYGDDTAKHRFQPPAKPTPWPGVRDCLAFGPQAPQPIHSRIGRSTFSPLDEANPTNSEDCLRLNVWAPALRDNKKRPVLPTSTAEPTPPVPPTAPSTTALA